MCAENFFLQKELGVSCFFLKKLQIELHLNCGVFGTQIERTENSRFSLEDLSPYQQSPSSDVPDFYHLNMMRRRK